MLDVAKSLGLRIRRGKAQCWRTENHRNGDADPSLSFFERRNRCRCFVCDMRGGHSNVDLVIGVLACDLGTAVQWIAKRFPVPNVKTGRPVGSEKQPQPYRVGVRGSAWEVIIRSGAWGKMTSAERSVLAVLDTFKDAESGVTRMSYRAIMRYGGIGKRENVSSALRELKKMHALQVSPGQRIGITRECSAYRTSLDDPKFLDLCNGVYAAARQEIAQEREYRASQKRERERTARKPAGPSLQVITQNTNTEGGRCPPAPPVVCVSNSNSKAKNQPQETPTCEGLNLSSPREPHVNKSVPPGNREISDSAFLKFQRDKEYILKHYGPGVTP